MSNADIITLPQVLAKVPELISNAPALIKGSLMSKNSNAKKPLGLGLALEDATAANPNGIALVYQDTQLTYRQFNAWVNRIAHFLSSRGLQKGDVVVVDIQNRPELLATVAGCSKLGVCAAMINTSQRGKVLVHSINLVKPTAAIIGEEQRESIEEVRDKLTIPNDSYFYLADQDTLDNPGETPDGYTNLATEIADRPADNPQSTRHIHLKDPAFYIYTSGTTGLPKAVVFNQGRFHRAYGGFGFAAVRLNDKDRLYCTLPMYHATGLAIGWGSVLAANAGIVLARKFSASRFWDDVRRYNCTILAYVGELCRYLHEQEPKPNDLDNKVRVIVGNGLRPGIWKDFKKRFGIDRVVELYASSEGNVAFTNVFNFDNTVGFSPVTYAIVQYDKENEAPVRNSKGHMVKVKKGEAGLMLGEITDKTPFEGYTDPEKTESSIFRDVFKKGDAWFNTGDMMRDIGFRHAQFVDRLGDTFRWKGENVSTTEVEQIIDAHECVAETVVYGVEIPNTNGRAGMAQIRLDKHHKNFDFNDLCAYLRRELPHYAIPVFLRINEGATQTTGTFKHQKNKLKEQSYDLSKQDNAVYVLLPGKDTVYQQLDETTQECINKGDYRF